MADEPTPPEPGQGAEGDPPPLTDDAVALRSAAAKAGMSPTKFAELSGKTTLADWEAQRAAGGGGT